MCEMMIDQAREWLKMKHISVSEVVSKREKEIEKLSQISARISQIMNGCWWPRYLWQWVVISYSDNEFKQYFSIL